MIDCRVHAPLRTLRLDTGRMIATGLPLPRLAALRDALAD